MYIRTIGALQAQPAGACHWVHNIITFEGEVFYSVKVIFSASQFTVLNIIFHKTY